MPTFKLKATIIALFFTVPAFCQLPISASDGYIWDGSQLKGPLGIAGLTQYMNCDHWEMWYFREGASQTPGMQWGSDSGKSPDEVTKLWQKNLKEDAEWKEMWTKYHMKWRPSAETWTNAEGPVCIAKTAFNTTPAAVQTLDRLTSMAQKVSGMIKTAREIVNTANILAADKGGSAPYYDKTGLENFLNNLSSIPHKIFSLRAMVLQHTTPNLIYVNSQLASLDRQITGLQAEATQLAAKYPAQRAEAPKDVSWRGHIMPKVVLSAATPGGSSVTDNYQFSEDGSTFSLQDQPCESSGKCYDPLTFSNVPLSDITSALIYCQDQGCYVILFGVTDSNGNKPEIWLTDEASAKSFAKYITSFNPRALWSVVQ